MHNLQCKLLLLSTFIVLVSCNQPTQVKQAAVLDAKVDVTSIYPHTEEFKQKHHGENFLQNATTCAKCHGSDLSGGNTQVSCQKCHTHPFGWASPQKHGAQYLSADKERRGDCLKCHQGEQAPQNLNCTNCHKAYPHKGRHGKIAQAYEGNCFSCHKQETHPNMPNKKACAECHDGELKIEWVEPKSSKAAPTKSKRLPTSGR